MAELISSPLADRHRGLGARLAAFAGWEMPIDYGSVVAEHTAVRTAVGVFDLSHLGSVSVTGDEAAVALQRALSNDIDKLDVGAAQYTLCLNEQGGIVDDLIVYRLPWGYWTVPNAANNAEVVAALRAAADGRDAQVTDHGAGVTCLAVQGRQSTTALAQAGLDPGELAFMGARVANASASAPDEPIPEGGLLARTGYTGERGYELFVPPDRAVDVWDRLLDAGATPVGLGARDTLRLEMGYPLHGNDLTTTTTPVEARLLWAVKLGTGFVGESAVAAAKEAGPPRRLRGLRATGRGVPRAGCAARVDDAPVGELSSGGFSPTLQTGIALAYLDTDIEDDTTVEIDVRGRTLAATVTKPPFVDRSPKD